MLNYNGASLDTRALENLKGNDLASALKDFSGMEPLKWAKTSSGVISIFSDRIIRMYIFPNMYYEKEKVLEDQKAIQKVAGNVLYPLINFVPEPKGASIEALTHAMSEEYTSHFSVNATVTNLKNVIIGNIIYAVNLGLKLLQSEFPVFSFFQNENDSLQWVEKMRNFSYVKVLETLKKQDFVILNGLLQSKSIIDIGKEINKSESTVRNWFSTGLFSPFRLGIR